MIFAPIGFLSNIERDTNYVIFKPFGFKSSYPLKLQTDTYQWAEPDAQMITRERSGMTQYYIRQENGMCTCENFLKKYMCKHLLGIAIRFKMFNVCQETKNIPISQKTKRGRPTLA